MKRLIVFCEGPTEQRFCAGVLQPHFFPSGSGVLHTLAVGEKNHHHVFGLGKRKKYQAVRKFIMNAIKQHSSQEVHFTTLFDLYGLPADFPGRDQHTLQASNPTPYVEALEAAFAKDINCHHFSPHLQLYEFETMLFTDPAAFAIAFENVEPQIEAITRLAASFTSIELINDGVETAPSKRIKQFIPEYDGRKATAGPEIARQIGLKTIRAKCPHLHKWVENLEQLLHDDKS